MPTVQDLSAVAWSEKAVASGKADKVPQALVGLLSPDETVRNRSYWQLDNEVVLQSDLYEAAYFAIPFLIGFLKAKSPYGRDRIYDLLYEIANGDAPPATTLRTNESDELPLRDACARELRKGLPAFVGDSVDADPMIRSKAEALRELLNVNKQADNAAPGVSTSVINRPPLLEQASGTKQSH